METGRDIELVLCLLSLFVACISFAYNFKRMDADKIKEIDLIEICHPLILPHILYRPNYVKVARKLSHIFYQHCMLRQNIKVWIP